MKRLFLSLAVLFGLIAPLTVGVQVYAATPSSSKEAACQAINGTYNAGDGSCDTGGGAKSSPEAIMKTVINLFSWIVGAIAVVMMIFGGFKYITSGGDSGKITTAKNTIIFAIIGLVIVAASQLIVNFVLNKTIQTTKQSSTSTP